MADCQSWLVFNGTPGIMCFVDTPQLTFIRRGMCMLHSFTVGVYIEISFSKCPRNNPHQVF